jgi:hypothetical protein
MVVVVVAIDQEFDRGLGNLADLIQVGFRRLRPAVADRIGDDDAGGRHDEHRLMVLIAENIDVIGALDLGGREHRLLRRRLCRRRGRRLGNRTGGETGREQRSRKCYQHLVLHGYYLP